jgi:hypothetical protein
LLFAFSSAAQVNDAGLWTSISLKKELHKKIDLNAESELRLFENLSEIRTSFIDLSAQYKINEFLRAGLNYRFGNRKQLDDSFDLRQRWAFDLVAKTKWKDLGIGLRSRFQQSIETLNSEADIEFNRTWRNKISLEHKVFKKTEAEFNAELFSSKQKAEHVLTDIRLSIGLNYKLKKRKIIKAGYLFQSEIAQPNPARDFVILLGYAYEFK